jgi:trehalose synthase
VTKKFHNAIQGDEINLTDLKKEIYESVVYDSQLDKFRAAPLRETAQG